MSAGQTQQPVTAGAFDPKSVPRERWAHALGMLLWQGMRQHPDVLFELVRQGEGEFVRKNHPVCKLGLKKDDYKMIFRRLARGARLMGFDPRQPLRRH